MFSSFFKVRAELALDWAFLASPLHIIASQESIMGQCPDKEIHLGESFHIPYAFPDRRVDRDRMINEHAITNDGGISPGFTPLASIILGSL